MLRLLWSGASRTVSNDGDMHECIPAVLTRKETSRFPVIGSVCMSAVLKFQDHAMAIQEDGIRRVLGEFHVCQFSSPWC
jgi:hypothetical protein